MIKFRDLYDAIRNTEIAYMRMGVDIEQAKCGFPKCVLSDAQEKLLESYMELADINVDFCDLDFQAIVEKIDDCFDCVTDEFKSLLPPPLPEPEESVDMCDGLSTVVPLEHIKRFRIYEWTYTSPSIPSPIQVYVMARESLPYEFEPSVPESVKSYERYRVSWNKQRNSLVISLDHSDFPESSGAPRGSYNISQVVAEIDDNYVGNYGRAEVIACTAMLMTSNVIWKTGHELDKAVDGNISTYTAYDNSPPEVTVEFQFKA